MQCVLRQLSIKNIKVISDSNYEFDLFFFPPLYRAIQTESSNETVRYWDLCVETSHKCVFDSVNPNIHSITFKSDSSFVTVKSGIFTDVAVTAMFFSNTFSFPLSLKTVRHCLLLAAFQGAAMLQKKTRGWSDNCVAWVPGCESTSIKNVSTNLP